MQKTVYERNFDLLQRVLGVSAENLEFHKSYHYKAKFHMDLVVERLNKNEISLTHYYEMNGDLMSDPDMVLKILPDQSMVEALSYRQDGLGIYQEVYQERDGVVFVAPRLKKELNDFLNQWLRNLIAQNHKLVTEG